MCQDGLILATDTQYTRGPMKSHGPKLFDLFAPLQNSNLAVLVAGAGRVPFMKRAIDSLENRLSNLTDPGLREVRTLAEDTLLQFFQKHVYPMPPHRQDASGFELILGVWTRRDGFGLFKTDVTTVNWANKHGTAHCSIGDGQYVSQYALDLAYDPGLSTEKAKFVAAFCIKAAKDYVASCGGRTRIQWLRFDGADCCHIRVYDPEVTEAEKDSSDLFDAVKYLIDYLDTVNISDDDSVGTMTDYIRDTIIDLRKKRRERAERVQQIRARALAKDAQPKRP